MSTVQTHSITDLAVAQLNTSRQFLLGLIDTLSDEQLSERAGGVGNHALWIMGHVALADDLFVSGFRQEPSCLPAGHADQFSPGTSPGHASEYPHRDELLRRLAVARQGLLQWANAWDGEAVWQPAPEQLAQFAPHAIAALFVLAQHEFMHAGQLTVVRASLGKKPLMM